MIPTSEEISNRTPANPDETTLEDAMPQAAWEALQGLRPSYTPETLRRWLQTTLLAWAIGAAQAPPPRQHHHTGRERAK